MICFHFTDPCPADLARTAGAYSLDSLVSVEQLQTTRKPNDQRKETMNHNVTDLQEKQTERASVNQSSDLTHDQRADSFDERLGLSQRGLIDVTNRSQRSEDCLNTGCVIQPGHQPPLNEFFWENPLCISAKDTQSLTVDICSTVPVKRIDVKVSSDGVVQRNADAGIFLDVTDKSCTDLYNSDCNDVASKPEVHNFYFLSPIRKIGPVCNPQHWSFDEIMADYKLAHPGTNDSSVADRSLQMENTAAMLTSLDNARVRLIQPGDEYEPTNADWKNSVDLWTRWNQEYARKFENCSSVLLDPSSTSSFPAQTQAVENITSDVCGQKDVDAVRKMDSCRIASPSHDTAKAFVSSGVPQGNGLEPPAVVGSVALVFIQYSRAELLDIKERSQHGRVSDEAKEIIGKWRLERAAWSSSIGAGNNKCVPGNSRGSFSKNDPNSNGREFDWREKLKSLQSNSRLCSSSVQIVEDFNSLKLDGSGTTTGSGETKIETKIPFSTVGFRESKSETKIPFTTAGLGESKSETIIPFTTVGLGKTKSESKIPLTIEDNRTSCSPSALVGSSGGLPDNQPLNIPGSSTVLDKIEENKGTCCSFPTVVDSCGGMPDIEALNIPVSPAVSNKIDAISDKIDAVSDKIDVVSDNIDLNNDEDSVVKSIDRSTELHSILPTPNVHHVDLMERDWAVVDLGGGGDNEELSQRIADFLEREMNTRYTEDIDKFTRRMGAAAETSDDQLLGKEYVLKLGSGGKTVAATTRSSQKFLATTQSCSSSSSSSSSDEEFDTGARQSLTLGQTLTLSKVSKCDRGASRGHSHDMQNLHSDPSVPLRIDTERRPDSRRIRGTTSGKYVKRNIEPEKKSSKKNVQIQGSRSNSNHSVPTVKNRKSGEYSNCSRGRSNGPVLTGPVQLDWTYSTTAETTAYLAQCQANYTLCSQYAEYYKGAYLCMTEQSRMNEIYEQQMGYIRHMAKFYRNAKSS